VTGSRSSASGFDMPFGSPLRGAIAAAEKEKKHLTTGLTSTASSQGMSPLADVRHAVF